MLATAMILPFACISCSSSDDDDDNKTEQTQEQNDQNNTDDDKQDVGSPEDNLPDEVKTFVGYWSGIKKLIFFSDGVGWDLETSGYMHNHGYWTYDPDTKILATTQSGQWQVTLSNQESWTGISIGNNKPNSFSRVKDKLEYIRYMLNYSSWVGTQDSTLTIGILQQYKIGYLDYAMLFTINGEVSMFEDYNHQMMQYCFLEVTEDDNTDDYTFKYKVSNEGFQRTGSGTITLKNPTSVTKQYIVLDGIINKTLKRVEN